MLHRITPLAKRGFVQGINAAVYDGASAIFPFLYAMLADNYGISVTLWTCAGVSCFAALVNLPLVIHPRLKRDSQDDAAGASARTVSLFLLEDDDKDDDEYSSFPIHLHQIQEDRCGTVVEYLLVPGVVPDLLLGILLLFSVTS
jgi:hypothetical protein